MLITHTITEEGLSGWISRGLVMSTEAIQCTLLEGI